MEPVSQTLVRLLLASWHHPPPSECPRANAMLVTVQEQRFHAGWPADWYAPLIRCSVCEARLRTDVVWFEPGVPL